MTTRPRQSADDLDLPAMLLHAAPLRHNVDLMAQYCAGAGVELAPHAKTSMTSLIARLQLAAGAWGQTAASVVQARHLHEMGVKKILMANVLVDRRGIDWVAEHLLTESDPESDFLCYVDSQQGVQILESCLDRWPSIKPLGVLVELGFTGGRTGARSVAAARDLAQMVVASPLLTLRGIAGFEGLMARGSDLVPPGLHSFLDALHETTMQCYDASLFNCTPIVTAGGSSYFDLVAQRLNPTNFGFAVTTILRSGCYATHDHGIYHETSPLDGRSNGGATFLPALELIAHVWSRPEEDLVIVGFGRRDVPTDDRLPIILGRLGEDGSVIEEPSAVVTGVNDQHAFVRVRSDCSWTAGDILSIGISHPCGAFDRWRSIPVVDKERRVIGEAAPML